MPSYSALPGFREFFPDEFILRAHITSAWRETALSYGYQEYDGPPLEPLELYTEKSGEEIVRQLYNFEDKGGRPVALRPEMTPTFARMVGARASGLRKPIRWFSIPQLFRYERTQRGRLREHFQWNVDLVGETDPAADAEVLAVALDGLRRLGLTATDIVARVNDRRLVEALLNRVGVAEARLGAAYAVIDKLGRDSRDTSRTRLRTEVGLAPAAIEQLFTIFDTEQLDQLAEGYGSDARIGETIERLQTYLRVLAGLGQADYVRFDLSIVRGLAYYTGIVFEIFDRQGELRAICGGGRYDTLLRTVSNVDLPALGFGMGDVVLGELLTDRALLPDTRSRLDYYIVAVTEAEQSVQRAVAQALRARGFAVSYGFGSGSVGKQFKDADARGAARVIVLGPEEVKVGIAVIREMAGGAQSQIPLAELLNGRESA
ncbi:MAG: histidine--tRNA ligase [Longimicrobiales bacterium]